MRVAQDPRQEQGKKEIGKAIADALWNSGYYIRDIAQSFSEMPGGMTYESSEEFVYNVRKGRFFDAYEERERRGTNYSRRLMNIAILMDVGRIQPDNEIVAKMKALYAEFNYENRNRASFRLRAGADRKRVQRNSVQFDYTTRNVVDVLEMRQKKEKSLLYLGEEKSDLEKRMREIEAEITFDDSISFPQAAVISTADVGYIKENDAIRIIPRRNHTIRLHARDSSKYVIEDISVGEWQEADGTKITYLRIASAPEREILYLDMSRTK